MRQVQLRDNGVEKRRSACDSSASSDVVQSAHSLPPLPSMEIITVSDTVRENVVSADER